MYLLPNHFSTTLSSKPLRRNAFSIIRTPSFVSFTSAIRSMVKDEDTVIREFNELVNMTPNELSDWLKTEDSTSSGWTTDSNSDETVGHESGRKIIEILSRNPKKDPDGYEADDVDHMRKVVAYCKRHLAQEEAAKQNPESKSYKSLKNWGHDALKC